MRKAGLAVLTLVASLGLSFGASAAEEGRAIPASKVDEKGITGKSTPQSATAVFAGGCFWGVQGVFQHVNGVTMAVSGYAGGAKATAEYRQVTTATTGHAEAVQVTYDPSKITYGKLLQIYFSVAHNPTQFNRQGPDVGPQYRSAIFPQNDEQADVARAYIDQLNQAKVFEAPVVTRIEKDQPFYPAEDYHQDYMTLHPTQAYIAINDLPKVGALKKYFPDAYRAVPILVGANKGSGSKANGG